MNVYKFVSLFGVLIFAIPFIILICTIIKGTNEITYTIETIFNIPYWVYFCVGFIITFHGVYLWKINVQDPKDEKNKNESTNNNNKKNKKKKK